MTRARALDWLLILTVGAGFWYVAIMAATTP